MSNSSQIQMRELGGLVDNLYLSSKNRHPHSDASATPNRTRRPKVCIRGATLPTRICVALVYGEGVSLWLTWKECFGMRGRLEHRLWIKLVVGRTTRDSIASQKRKGSREQVLESVPRHL